MWRNFKQSILVLTLSAYWCMQAYSEKKVHLVKAEKMILTQLGFILHVDHPHKDMLNYLHYLQASPSLMQVAWNLTNDR